MFEFIVGALVGSVLTVLIPAVYNWTSAKITQVKNKIN